jgi:hypothetical protein
MTPPSWLPQWLPIMIATVVVLGFCWKLLPEERKYWFWLRTRLLRFNLSLKTRGSVKRKPVTEYYLAIANPGMNPKFPVYLKTSEPSKRWYLSFDEALELIKWNEIQGQTNDEYNPRINVHKLPNTNNNTRIGFYAYYNDLPDQKTYREYLNYEFGCLNVIISKGTIEIP